MGIVEDTMDGKLQRVDAAQTQLVELSSAVDVSELTAEQQTFLESVAREMEHVFEQIAVFDREIEHVRQRSEKHWYAVYESDNLSLDERHSSKRASICHSCIDAAALRRLRYGSR